MKKKTTKQINIALQGGGAHGAFTWGVLDRLLEEEDLEIAGISGTSAGALNGAALKSGLVENGRDGAKKNLAWLWSEIGATKHDSMYGWMTGISPQAISRAVESSPFYQTLDFMSRMASPYQFGPLYHHPLRRIADQFAYDRVCTDQGPELHICATNVRTGRIKVFQGIEITTDAILASGCLPTVFQAIEIEDPDTGAKEAYWDGGYMGNPALFPLFADTLPRDIVVVNINPLYRDEVPRTPQAIQNRLNEISFNGSLLRELRAINFVQRLIEKGNVSDDAMKNPIIHMIADDDLMNQLSVATKLIPTPPVLDKLKTSGRRAAGAFLRDHWACLGARNSVDLRAMFQ